MAVVFTDNFTVGANTNIGAYPSGGDPDYAYTNGSGGDMEVNASNDRVQLPQDNYTVVARIIDAAAPTGDQEITADCFSTATHNSAGVAARCASGSNNCYITYLENTAGNECRLIRIDSGTETLLDSFNAGFSGASARSHRLKVTGAGATVTVEWQIGTMTARIANDSHANRKTSGPPGIAGFNDVTNAVYIDNVIVDDLSAGGTNATATPGLLEGEGELFAPTIATIRNAVALAEFLTGTGTLFGPTVVGQNNVVTVAEFLTGTGTLFDPTIATGVNVTVLPALIEGLGVLYAPTIVGMNNEIVAGSLFEGTGTLFDPAVVTTDGEVNVVALVNLLTGEGILFDPTVTKSVTVTPDLLVGLGTLFDNGFGGSRRSKLVPYPVYLAPWVSHYRFAKKR